MSQRSPIPESSQGSDAGESPYATHRVTNQAVPLEGLNSFTCDPVLREGSSREGASWAAEELESFGELCGRPEVIELGFLANRYPPTLETHDRFGHRIDEVELHPAWHRLMQIGIEAEIHSLPWNRPRPGAHVARAAKHYLLGQVEAGVLCPLTMTFAAVPALEMEPEVAAEWVPRVRSTRYDPRAMPAGDKTGATLGMAMTEKQGGSDVRANTTRAVAGGEAGEYFLTGHKWFCSAPRSDAFLTLAQAEAGLTCFLVPRWTPDGERNRFFLQRLKNKLGNRSNASSEVEYRDTWARRVGAEGRGIATILEMVNHTRLDCMLGSSALMRQALAQATHHGTYRKAFGKHLRDHPLMRNVWADLALEWEAATALSLRVARAFEEASESPEHMAFRRLATAVGKYWICKRAPGFVAEALECLGGNGYVEESILPRLYREAPLLSIWEGSGNVMCLDVLRVLQREPLAWPALRKELEPVLGVDRRLDEQLVRIEEQLGRREELERGARRLVEDLALVLQAALLVQNAPLAVADAFCASRLGDQRGREYGTLTAGVDLDPILERAVIAPGS